MRGVLMLGSPRLEIPAGVTYDELAAWIVANGGDPSPLVAHAARRFGVSLGISFSDIRKAAGKATRSVFEVAGMPTVGKATVSISDTLRKAVTAGLDAGRAKVEGAATTWAAETGQRLIDALPLPARARAGAYALAPWLIPAGLAFGAWQTRGVLRLGLGAAAAFAALSAGRK